MTRTCPDVGKTRPVRMRSRVVLPAPFGPSRARISRGATFSETPRSACLGPKDRTASVTAIALSAGTPARPFGSKEGCGGGDVATSRGLLVCKGDSSDPVGDSRRFPPRIVGDLTDFCAKSRGRSRVGKGFEDAPESFPHQAQIAWTAKYEGRKPDQVDQVGTPAGRDLEHVEAEQMLQ